MGRRQERQASPERVEDQYEKNRNALLEYAKSIVPKATAMDLIGGKEFVARLKRLNHPKGKPFLEWAKHILCQCDEVISYRFEVRRSELLDYAYSFVPTIAAELIEELAIQLKRKSRTFVQNETAFPSWAKKMLGQCETLIVFLHEQHKDEIEIYAYDLSPEYAEKFTGKFLDYMKRQSNEFDLGDESFTVYGKRIIDRLFHSWEHIESLYGKNSRKDGRYGFLEQRARKMGISESEIEDCVQEFWIRILQNAAVFDHQRGIKFITWFSGCFNNYVLEFHRNETRVKHGGKEVIVPWPEGGVVDRRTDRQDSKNQEALRDCMKRLEKGSKICFDALELRFLQGNTPGECQKSFGVNSSTFSNRLARGKQMLKECLEEKELKAL